MQQSIYLSVSEVAAHQANHICGLLCICWGQISTHNYLGNGGHTACKGQWM